MRPGSVTASFLLAWLECTVRRTKGRGRGWKSGGWGVGADPEPKIYFHHRCMIGWPLLHVLWQRNPISALSDLLPNTKGLLLSNCPQWSNANDLGTSALLKSHATALIAWLFYDEAQVSITSLGAVWNSVPLSFVLHNPNSGIYFEVIEIHYTSVEYEILLLMQSRKWSVLNHTVILRGDIYGTGPAKKIMRYPIQLIPKRKNQRGKEDKTKIKYSIRKKKPHTQWKQNHLQST